MEALYHYTDLHAFLSIVQNKKLWLTGAHNLNDHQEINWTISKIHRRLLDLSQKHGQERAQIIWNLLNASGGTPYICALSSESDLLSQWRAYGQDGTGVSIGFKKDLLPKSDHLPILTAAKQDSISLHQVIYDQKMQDEIIENLLTLVFELPELNDQTHMAVSSAASQLSSLAIIFKNEAFHEEKEWRIVHRPLIMGRPGAIEAKNYLSISKPKHRISNGRLVTYFEYDLSGTTANSAFAEIVLGPKCEMSDYDLAILFDELDFKNLPIRRSKATYR
jgi:Protein of unknown function (DUF2971)